MLKLKLELLKEQFNQPKTSGVKDFHLMKAYKNDEFFYIQYMTLDDIESLEIQLTEIIMQLYKYRKEQK